LSANTNSWRRRERLGECDPDLPFMS
jgi:hypothetical protein